MKVFGDFEFDDRSMQLRRRGAIVSLNGQCVELLAVLLEGAGQLVTRAEITSRLWPDSNVDFEHSVDVLVSRLRLALGEGKERRYIQTVRKKGYRFVEKVRSGPPAVPVNRVKRAGVVLRYASVALLAALTALLIAHTRYQKFVPPRPAAPTSLGSKPPVRPAHARRERRDSGAQARLSVLTGSYRRPHGLDRDVTAITWFTKRGPRLRRDFPNRAPVVSSTTRSGAIDVAASIENKLSPRFSAVGTTAEVVQRS